MRTSGAALMLAVTLAIALAFGAGAQVPRVHAIVLAGNDQTGGPAYGRGALQGAFDRNTERIVEAFTERLGIETILKLHAEEVTEEGFETSVREFIAGVGPGDTLVFYYAGHGLDGYMHPFFVEVDAEIAAEEPAQSENAEPPAQENEDAVSPDADPHGTYRYEALAELLQSAACQTLIILDACFSGSALDLLDDAWTVVASCRADQSTLLAWAFGSVFNLEFTTQLRHGYTRLEEILAGVDQMYGEQFQVSGDVTIDLAAPSCP